MRILIGITEISNNIKEFADALTESGYSVDTIAHENVFYKNNNYTYRLSTPDYIKNIRFVRAIYRQLLLLWHFIRAIVTYNVFVFVWTTTFLPLHLDLFILRLLGKKVIVFNCGDDVRYRPIHERINMDVFGHKPFWSLNNLLFKGQTFARAFFDQKTEEASGCTIVSMRNQATFQKKDCFLFRFPTKSIVNSPKNAKDIPLIIHAPSDTDIKGTSYVMKAIDVLKSERLQFEFELIMKRPNEYVLSRLKDADILIDQPGPWIAKLASEGLAASCVVIGGNMPEYEGYDDNSPVIQFKSDELDLANILRILIKDKSYRQDLMIQSYSYWENYYSPKAFANYFKDVLAGTAKKIGPLENHKNLLLNHALNKYQRTIIRLFY